MTQHAAGPYAGLRQIVGVFTAEDSQAGRIPDVMPHHPNPPMPWWPDGRLAKALRLKSTDRYVLYTEQVVAGSVASQEAPAA